MLTRRSLLKLSAATLLTHDLWPGSLAAADTAVSDFSFVVVNDLHYVDQDCGRFLQDTVVRMINQAEGGVDFTLVLGDLSEHGTAEATGAVRDVLNTLKAPYHVVPGNHDYDPATQTRPYDALFPKQLNYTFEHNGVQFVALDTTDKRAAKNVAASAETMAFLRDAAPKLDKQKPTVLFTHFPLSHWTFYHLTNNDEVLDTFREHNLVGSFSGHFHGFTEEAVRGVPVVTNKCCSLRHANHDFTRAKGYFHCRMTDGKLTRTFIEVPMPPLPVPPSAATQPGKRT